MGNKERPRFVRAVGLQYDEESDRAPKICVKGEAESADEIVRLARRYGVPVVERGEIADVLGDISLEETIPEDLYEAVAVILSELRSFQNRSKQ